MHNIYRNEKEAIGGFKDRGPVFGDRDEHDLILSWKKYPEEPNRSELGVTYSLPADVSYKSMTAKSYLGGSYKFAIEEYEVFAVKIN